MEAKYYLCVPTQCFIMNFKSDIHQLQSIKKGQTVDLIAVVGVIVLMHFAAQKSSDIGKRGICAKGEVIFGIDP